MGVIDVLDPPYPAEWDGDVIRKGFAEASEAYVEMLEDIDAAVMMPGANPVLPAYRALQMLLLEKGGPRRTIHFHWTDPYSPSGNVTGLTGVNVLPGHPPPPFQVIDAVYQHAVLNTDLDALDQHQDRFIEALRDGDVRVTSPAGTDIRFRVAGRDIIQQNGDASAARMRKGAPISGPGSGNTGRGCTGCTTGIDRARKGCLSRTRPGTVTAYAMPPLSMQDGRIARVSADDGEEHLRAEIDCRAGRR